MLSDEYTTLAETLKARGYRTAAFMPNPSLHRSFNFGQGFDLYDDDLLMGEGPADMAYPDRAEDRRSRPALAPPRPREAALAYLHYRDVHARTSLPRPTTHVPESRPRPAADRGRAGVAACRHQGPAPLPDLDSYIDQYDGEIRYTDDRLAVLLGTLEKEGSLDETVLFVTADPGETSLEHGT